MSIPKGQLLVKCTKKNLGQKINLNKINDEKNWCR